jgi:hypothetical protein
MKSVMTLVLLLAGIFVSASSANAQSVDFRIGTGVYSNGGYGHGGWHGNRRDGVSIDIRIGDRHRHGNGCGRYNDCGPVYRGPVYRDNDCRRGCGDYGGYRGPQQTITVIVSEQIPVYDRWGNYRGTTYQDRRVIAYWNPQRGGYYYTDRHGNYIRVRGY